MGLWQEHLEFKAILSSIMGMGPAWARDPISKLEGKKERNASTFSGTKTDTETHRCR